MPKFAVEGDLRREVSMKHQAADGLGMLSGHSAPQGLPMRGQRTPHQRPHPQGTAQAGGVKMNAPPGKV